VLGEVGVYDCVQLWVGLGKRPVGGSLDGVQLYMTWKERASEGKLCRQVWGGRQGAYCWGDRG
jgi:hypothetical protein